MKFFLIIFFLLHTTLLYSDDIIDEIIVTAELSDNSLYRLPISASVIDEEVIKNRDAQHIEDILFSIPNINYSTGSSRGKFLQIRGIGERSEFTEPVNYSVGVIIDGIDFTGISLAASTFDIEQIEVLRGPQGTIYGANALAGLVNIVSNKPEEEFYSEISGSLSEFDGRSLGFVFTGPLNENSGFRFGVKKYENDGFIKNPSLYGEFQCGTWIAAIACLDYAGSAWIGQTEPCSLFKQSTKEHNKFDSTCLALD